MCVCLDVCVCLEVLEVFTCVPGDGAGHLQEPVEGSVRVLSVATTGVVMGRQ